MRSIVERTKDLKARNVAGNTVSKMAGSMTDEQKVAIEASTTIAQLRTALVGTKKQVVK